MYFVYCHKNALGSFDDVAAVEAEDIKQAQDLLKVLYNDVTADDLHKIEFNTPFEKSHKIKILTDY